MRSLFRLLLPLFALPGFQTLQAQTESWTVVNERFKQQYAAGRYQEAMRSGDTALQLALRLHGKNHENYGKSLQNLGVLYFSLGDYPKASIHFTEALRVRENVHGSNSPEAISTLNNLAVLYKAQALYEKAGLTLSESRKRIEMGPGKESDVYARNLVISASLAAQQAQYESARSFLLEALENTRRRKGRVSTAYADILNDLAINAENRGDLKGSAQYYTEAMGVVDSVQGKNNTVYARLLGNVGSIYKQLGQTMAAEAALRRSIELYQAYSADSNAAAAPLNNLGTLYLDLSRPQQALACFQRSAAMYRNTRTENSREYGMSLNNIGMACKALGQYAEARKNYQEALDIRTAVLGAGHPDVAATLNNLGVLYEDLNNHTLALQHHIAAAEIRKNALGAAHPDYAASLYNRARIHSQLKDYEQALSLHRQALDIRLRVFGPEGLPVATSNEAMAGVYADMKQYADAEKMYLPAAAIYRKKLGLYSEAYAMALYNLSTLYTSWKLYDKAGFYFDSTFNILDSLPHARKLQMQSRAAHCGFLLQAPQPNQLIPAAIAFQNWLEKDCRTMFSTLSESEQNQYAYIVFHHFDLLRSIYLRWLGAKPQLAQQLLETELFTKGLTLNQGIEMRRRIENSGNREAIAMFDEMLQLKQALANAYANRNIHVLDIQDLERRQQLLEQELSKRSLEFRSGTAEIRPDWKYLRDRLGDDEAWIEFSRFRLHGSCDWTDSMMYLAIVVRKQMAIPQIIPLFEEKQVSSLLQQAHSGEALYRGGKTVSNNSLTSSYGSKVYQLLWKPLVPAVGKSRRIYFSAAGQLHQIAFAAIPVDSGGLLSDKYELVQLKSGSALLATPSFNPSGKGSILLLGGLDYDSKGTGKGHWEYLPGTKAETASIQQLAAGNGFAVHTLTASLASETQLQAMCKKQRPEVVHFSTHGYFKGPAKAAGELADYLTARGSAMNQSGLLLSGGNAGWDNGALPESDNGILTALEAGNLPLRGTLLVALSACETGWGEITESEGVFGLQRAFWLAGASYILMSLWKVPDLETARYMDAFYTHYCKYRNPQQAFYHAQQTMKTLYPDNPSRWAAFILVH